MLQTPKLKQPPRTWADNRFQADNRIQSNNRIQSDNHPLFPIDCQLEPLTVDVPLRLVPGRLDLHPEHYRDSIGTPLQAVSAMLYQGVRPR